MFFCDLVFHDLFFRAFFFFRDVCSWFLFSFPALFSSFFWVIFVFGMFLICFVFFFKICLSVFCFSFSFRVFVHHDCVSRQVFSKCVKASTDFEKF